MTQGLNGHVIYVSMSSRFKHFSKYTSLHNIFTNIFLYNGENNLCFGSGRHQNRDSPFEGSTTTVII